MKRRGLLEGEFGSNFVGEPIRIAGRVSEVPALVISIKISLGWRCVVALQLMVRKLQNILEMEFVEVV